MVSTRHHPRAYPPPPDTPTKSEDGDEASAAVSTTATRSTRSARGKSRTSSSPAMADEAPESPTSSAAAAAKARRSGAGRTQQRAASGSGGAARWAHTPSHLTLVWLAVSLPLVLWDTGYVLGRPATMPGGWAHAPLWKPYDLYGRVDYIYGWPALESRNGFTSAQGTLNLVETALYVAYLWLVWAYGSEEEEQGTGQRAAGGRSKKAVEGRGAPSSKLVGWLGEARTLGGRAAGLATMLGFTASVMTLSKTLLYWLNEYFSGFSNIGHNPLGDLILLWIIPNGAWIVLPTYMIYAFGAEILEGLTIATGAPVPQALAIKDE